MLLLYSTNGRSELAEGQLAGRGGPAGISSVHFFSLSNCTCDMPVVVVSLLLQRIWHTRNERGGGGALATLKSLVVVFQLCQIVQTASMKCPIRERGGEEEEQLRGARERGGGLRQNELYSQ